MDRALLILIFTGGVWYGTQDVRAVNLGDDVKALKVERQLDHEEMAQIKLTNAVLATRLAEIDRRLGSIDQNLDRVARAVENGPLARRR